MKNVLILSFNSPKSIINKNLIINELYNPILISIYTFSYKCSISDYIGESFTNLDKKPTKYYRIIIFNLTGKFQ